ncbi:Lrp/AsnC family transcriptional regulator [Limimaricola soesokkakensis]|uniref:Leucine-responsive regulatory protein n=2 Tax=Limimaricola TaxID=2211638 RepID=A0A1X6ZQW8_9RHOB|nr:Lrp/AsnC family transcriptional regulator [Limimaricola soesokkakensis]PSK84102.1 Lrp/AsnC family transcriptional regulator [Limimaricola soesokkakensis]SLN59025.1 Leucine-responsive regulatory protein [Limimaricola soesokkakensis]
MSARPIDAAIPGAEDRRRGWGAMGESGITLDETDRRLLRLLQAEPDLTLREVGERLGLSHTPCWRRLTRMREAGVIEERRHIIDPVAAGFDITVFCAVRMNGHSRAHLEEFEAAVVRIAEVVQCYTVSGDHDYLLRVLARSIRHYESTVKNALVQLPHVLSISTSVTLREIKNTTDVPL